MSTKKRQETQELFKSPLGFIINRHSNETVTLTKDITKYKNIPKWIVENLKKIENRRIKFVELTQFASPNI